MLRLIIPVLIRVIPVTAELRFVRGRVIARRPIIIITVILCFIVGKPCIRQSGILIMHAG